MTTFVGYESRPRIEDYLNWVISQQALDISIAPKSAEINLSGDFEGNRIVLADTKYGSDGKLYIYDYNDISNTWSSAAIIDAPESGETNFGSSVSMDWDGRRIAVGASTSSKVYIYDIIGTNWVNTGTIVAENLMSDFGYSVALAQNNPEILCIGAPLGSNVFVYEKRNDNWLKTFYDNGLNIKNRVPLTATSNVVLRNTFSRYGFHVSISPNGNYITAGAPGFNEYAEPIDVSDPEYSPEEGADNNRYDLSAEHIDYIEYSNGTTVYIDINDTTTRHRIGILYYGLYGPQTRQLGNARVFSKGGAASWSDGDNISFKIGQDIEGDQGESTLENYPWSDSFRYYPNKGWGFPGFGMCTHISDELDLIVSSPLTPVHGGDYTIANGAVQRFKYDNGIWVKSGAFIASPKPRLRFGSDFTLDHTSGRIMIIGTDTEYTTDQSVPVPSVLNVQDWSGTDWFDSQPLMSMGVIQKSYNPSFDRLNVYSATGKNIFVISARYGFLFTKVVELTQKFVGNSLFSGYIKTPNIYIGLNNVDDTNEIPRMISFGGTFNDVGYENSIIENRSLLSGDLGGRSELLLYKKTGDKDGLDFVRIKANEFHVDTSHPEYIYLRNPDPAVSGKLSVYDILDDKTIHTPAVIVNARGCVCINHNMNENFIVNNQYRGSVESKAYLDVNGDSLIRNKLNVNYSGRSELKNATSEEPHVFYDTRDTSILYTIPESGAIRVRSKTRPFETSEARIYGVLSGDTVYSDAYKSFYFGSTRDGQIETKLNWPGDGLPARLSTWILLKDNHSVYDGNIFTVTQDNEFLSTDKMECTLQIVSSGFKITYTDLLDPTNTFSFDLSTTIPTDTWTHIELRLPGGVNTTPVLGTVDGDSGTTTVSLWINGVVQGVGWTSSGTPSASTIGREDRVNCVFGGNVENMYMGMMMLWIVIPYSPNVSTAVNNNYNNGPPTEMLTVGGDAIVSGKVGIGVTNPQYQLDVNGNAQTAVGRINRSVSIRDVNSGYNDLTSGSSLNLGALQSGVTGSFQSPMIQRGIQSNFNSADGANWAGNRMIIGFRYVSVGTGLSGAINSFRVYSNNYQTTTFTYYDWTAPDDGFDRGYMSTTSPPVIAHTGDVPSIWLQNQSPHTIRINAIWIEYVNI